MQTINEQAITYTGYFGASIGQSVPVHPKSFLYEMARNYASIATAVYKMAELSRRENLASTASREGLILINRDVLKREPYVASASEITATFPMTTGTVVPAGTAFTCSENGLTYKSTITVVKSDGGSEHIPMISDISGGYATPEIGFMLKPQSPVAGLSDTGTVLTIDSFGVSEETTEEYRQKTLDQQYAHHGGSNLADYRIWGQEVPSVERVYPYYGQFNTDGTIVDTILAGRTVFVQASSSIHPDGIAPTDLCTEVLNHILRDPETQQDRLAAGVPNSRLVVKSISTSQYNVRITGTDSSWNNDNIKTAIFNAIDTYFKGLKPFIDGLDPVEGRTNEITSINLADVVHDIFISYGINASQVDFALTSAPSTYLTRSALIPGTLPRLNAVYYE